MEELIFFAIIIFFSIIDSIARKRKKRHAESDPSQLPQEWEEAEELPTYDAEPSYDDRHEVRQYQARTLPEYKRPGGTQTRKEPSSARSSEAMIPADLWEEVAGLARGRLPEPKPTPTPTPVEIEPIPPRPVTTHRVHRAHAYYGTDPSSRPRSEQDAVDSVRRTLSRDASAVRRQLRSHSKSALRRAILLQEIIGPPAASMPESALPTRSGQTLRVTSRPAPSS